MNYFRSKQVNRNVLMHVKKRSCLYSPCAFFPSSSCDRDPAFEFIRIQHASAGSALMLLQLMTFEVSKCAKRMKEVRKRAGQK